jgi:hypothetical protein
MSQRLQTTDEASTPHLFTVEEYLALDIPGRTELIEGVIYDVAAKHEPHILAVSRLIKILNRGLDDGLIVRGQDPIALSGWTGTGDPEIDIVVARDKVYATRATAKDAFAFAEVSDTTYSDDRKVKIPLCVATGVPTWHVNIPNRQVEFYASGASSATPTSIFVVGETFRILGVEIGVADLFEG